MGLSCRGYIFAIVLGAIVGTALYFMFPGNEERKAFKFRCEVELRGVFVDLYHDDICLNRSAVVEY